MESKVPEQQTVPAPVVPLRDAPAALPPMDAPRPLTSDVKKKIWFEPRVRQWWLTSILVLLIFGAFAGDRFWARVVETRLIRTGIVVTAKIVGAENKIEGHPTNTGDLVKLDYTMPDKSEQEVVGRLTADNFVGGQTTIRVDPADYTVWTDRTQPTPILDSMLIGFVGLPIIPVLLLIAWWQSSILTKTWESGSVQPAIIFDRKQSPIAPMSYAVRCSLQKQRQKQLFLVHVPRIGYGLEKGDLIWVIVPQKSGRPVAAMWMPAVVSPAGSSESTASTPGSRS